MAYGANPADAVEVTALNTTGLFALGSFGLAVVGPVAEAVGAVHVLAFAATGGLLSGVVVCCLPCIRPVRWRGGAEATTLPESATYPRKGCGWAGPGAFSHG